jgi:hypothetical protein
LNPPEEFLKHAADCAKMAKSTRDSQSSVTWNRMAERWRQCAEKFQRESLAANNHTPTRHRKPEPAWLATMGHKEARRSIPSGGASSICATGWEIYPAGRSIPEQSSAYFHTMTTANRAGKEALKQLLDKLFV